MEPSSIFSFFSERRIGHYHIEIIKRNMFLREIFPVRRRIKTVFAKNTSATIAYDCHVRLGNFTQKIVLIDTPKVILCSPLLFFQNLCHEPII